MSPLKSLADIVPLPTGNVELGWDAAGERLVIMIGCAKARRDAAFPSATGKTRLLATSHGYMPVDLPQPGLAGLKLQLTVTLPPLDAAPSRAARRAARAEG